MRVKICGLTRAEDALRAQRLGAWALGFIFTPKSKRYITPEAARAVFADLEDEFEDEAKTVGVFVNQTDEALDIAAKLGLQGIQLHGDETPEDCARARKGFGGMLIKAFRPRQPEDLAALKPYHGIIDYALLDTAAEGHYGGSGQTGDWDLAAAAAGLGAPVILAGGLNPANILAAFDKAKPFAADLSSGVEASPGIKDAGKLEALFDVLDGV
jgi:phosphoribosylanthranilate isomerase